MCIDNGRCEGKIEIEFCDLAKIIRGEKVVIISKDEYHIPTEIKLKSWEVPVTMAELTKKIKYWLNDHLF